MSFLNLMQNELIGNAIRNKYCQGTENKVDAVAQDLRLLVKEFLNFKVLVP